MTIDATGSEDAWQRQCLIEIDDGTSTMSFMAVTDTVDISGGERGLDKIDLVNLGQIPKHGAPDIITITIEGYARFVGTASAGVATGFYEIYAAKPVQDAVQPLDIDMSNVLTKYRVAIMWTDDPAATAAGGATAASTNARRFVLAECFSVGNPWAFTDKILKDTLVFKGVAFDTTGAATGGNNAKAESAVDTAMVTLGAYTPGTTKWA